MGAVAATFALSPWPSALVIRWAFDRGGWAFSRALEKHVPEGIVSHTDIPYGPDGARLDIHLPRVVGGPLPVIVWVHGGGWVAGSKDQIANYLKVLAGQGFAVVGVGYSIAPGALYPTPLHQVGAALAFLAGEGARFGLDGERLLLAGDSAGAQIAAQLANILTAPDYAKAVGMAPTIGPERLRGVLLFCGAYELAGLATDGLGGLFVNAVLWAYSGRRDFTGDSAFARAAVTPAVTGNFPPAFLSAGNGDPLEGQSRALAARLDALGVRVETLFFPKDHAPKVGHVYQFDLDRPEGREALSRAVAFAREVSP